MYGFQTVPEIGQLELLGPNPPEPAQSHQAEPASESFVSVLSEVSGAGKTDEVPPEEDEAPPSGEVPEAEAAEASEAELDALVAVMVLFQGDPASEPPPVMSHAVVESSTPVDTGAGEAAASAHPAVSQARYQVLASAGPAEAEAVAKQEAAASPEAAVAVPEQQGDVPEMPGVPEEASDTSAEVSVASAVKARIAAAEFIRPEILAPAVAEPAVAPAGTDEPDVAAQEAKPAPSTEPVPVPQAAVRTTEVVQEPQGVTVTERVSIEGLPEYTVRSVRHLATGGGGKVTVRLVPESLGEVHLEVSSQNESVTVRLISQSPAVREALEAQITGLRDALAREGIDVARVTVSADAGAGRQGQSGESRQPAQFEHAPRLAGGTTSGYTAGGAESGLEARWRVPSHHGTLNLFA